MSPLTRFRINSPKVIHETIDGEVVIVNLDNGNYYSLDKAGAAIWSWIRPGVALREIVAEIVQRYAGDRTALENAVHRLVAELQQENLIAPCEGAEAEPCVAHGATVAAVGSHGFEEPALHKYTEMQDLLLLDPIHEVDEAGWPSRGVEATNESA